MKNSNFMNKTSHAGKQYFLFTTLALAMISAPLSVACADVAPTTARKQIYAAVQEQASKLIRQEAKKRGWPKYSAQLNIFVPPDATQLPLCSTPLKTTLDTAGRVNLNRLRMTLRCDSAPGWTSSVAVKPDIAMPVLVASASLERGHVLTEDDLSLRKYNITGSRGDFIWQSEDVIGLKLKRRLREMTPITKNMLESPVMVERGQEVVMLASQDGVTAQTVGTAMKKGRRGETIKVKNESSGQEISARVTDFGTVLVSGKAGK